MVPKTPTGTLTQNTAAPVDGGQQAAGDQPDELPARPATWLMPSAKPRCSAGKASVRIAAEFAISMDPPTACSRRQPISHSAPWPPVNGSKDSRMDATVKTTKPEL